MSFGVIESYLPISNINSSESFCIVFDDVNQPNRCVDIDIVRKWMEYFDKAIHSFIEPIDMYKISLKRISVYCFLNDENFYLMRFNNVELVCMELDIHIDTLMQHIQTSTSPCIHGLRFLFPSKHTMPYIHMPCVSIHVVKQLMKQYAHTHRHIHTSPLKPYDTVIECVSTTTHTVLRRYIDIEDVAKVLHIDVNMIKSALLTCTDCHGFKFRVGIYMPFLTCAHACTDIPNAVLLAMKECSDTSYVCDKSHFVKDWLLHYSPPSLVFANV